MNSNYDNKHETNHLDSLPLFDPIKLRKQKVL
jgi:hypothetical protein